MFSSQISKSEMKLYLETVYWENILFLEISIIISNHCNALSEEEKNCLGSATFSWRSATVSFLSLPASQATAQINRQLPVQTTQRGQACPLHCVGQGNFPCPGYDSFSQCPLSVLDKSCSSLFENTAQNRGWFPSLGDCCLSS